MIRMLVKRLACLVFFATVVAWSAAAGGPQEQPSAEERQDSSVQRAESDQRYQEAPSLAQRVSAGELPPVEERLPGSPMVVNVREVGVYGGELYLASPNSGQPGVWLRAGLLEWPIGEFDEPGLGLAEEMTVNSNATRFTFRLRDDLRWSDGEPFGVHDLEFWWDHIIENPELTPSMPSWLLSGNEPGEFEVVDERTVRFSFSRPYPFFPKQLAFRGSINLFEGIASHYLERFHPEFVDSDELSRMVRAEGFDTWVQLFRSKLSPNDNVELPTMNAWMLTQGFPGQRMVLERNPYYYKVDTAGNQLPYLDRVIVLYASNNQVVQLMALDGQLDMQYTFLGFDQFPLLQDGAAQGGYRVQPVAATSGVINVYFNLNAQDEQRREFYQNSDFRRALSHAIDRQEMIDLHLFGQAEVTSPVVSRNDPYYAPGTGTAGTDYDVELANQLLDRAGLRRRNADGWRLLPDGSPFTVTVESFPLAIGLDLIELTTMLAEDWRAVGINAQARELEASLYYDRRSANELELPVTNAQDVGWDFAPLWFVPNTPSAFWAPEYGRWHQSNGAEGVEPPPEIKELVRIWEELESESDADERTRLGQQIMEIHEQELFFLSIVRFPSLPMVINTNLRNVPEGGIASYYHVTEAFTWPEQVFYVNGRRR